MSSAVVRCPTCGTNNRVPKVAHGVPHCSSCHGSLPWLVEAGEADFDAVTAGRLPVLVDLWAPWCGPCRIVAPGVEQASQDFAGRLKVVKVNVDQAPGVATRFAVQGIPTLLLVRNGQLVDRRVGALPTRGLLEWLTRSLPAAAAREHRETT